MSRPLDRWWTLPVLTLDEAAQVSGLCTRQIDRMIAAGQLERRGVPGLRKTLVTTTSFARVFGLPPGARIEETPERRRSAWAEDFADRMVSLMGSR